MRFPFLFISTLVLFATYSLPAQASSVHDFENTLGPIPVQHEGRVKPFQSFAQEMFLSITTKTSLEGMSPTVAMWSWLAAPDEWSQKPLIPVSHPELRHYFEDDLEHKRIAPIILLSDVDFFQEIRGLQEKSQKKETLTALDKKKLELYHKARLFEEVARGRSPGIVPHPDDPSASWLPFEGIATEEGITLISRLYPEQSVRDVNTTLTHLIKRIRENSFTEATEAAEHFSNRLKDLLATRNIILDDARVKLELLYLKLKPFRLGWILYLVSALLWSLPKKQQKSVRVTFGIFLLAFIFHTFGFVLRILISGRAPVTNMFETVIWVPWAAILFSIVLFLFFRSALAPAIAAWVTTLALFLAENAPVFLDSAITPLVPVLRSNYWLTIHVLTITLSYGAFALNWGIAHALLYNLAMKPRKKKRIGMLTEYLYRSLQIGIILLGAGTVLGGVWASYSWGRFWGWDPKETWALIAFISYLAVFHGRVAGWLDEFGVAFWCAMAFLTVIMAWYGVNFVLGAGLHSYGFGGGGLNYILATVGADLAFLSFLKYRFQAAKP
jgi:cytochrome c-type biogenesis protein CcsB